MGEIEAILSFEVRRSTFDVRGSRFEVPRVPWVQGCRFCTFDASEASQIPRLFGVNVLDLEQIVAALRVHLVATMGKGAKNFQELRVWHAASEFKNEVYRLVDSDAFRRESRLRDQLREAAASAVSQFSEGSARFEPADQARFMRMAKASLVECQTT